MADAALPRDQVFPALLGPDAQRTDQTNARNNNPASQLDGSFKRGFACGLLALAVLLDVLVGVLHGRHLFGVLVRHFNAEGLFKRHNQFHLVERIRAQVVHERRGRRDLRLIHTKLLDDDLLYAFFHAGHAHSSATRCRMFVVLLLCTVFRPKGRPTISSRLAYVTCQVYFPRRTRSTWRKPLAVSRQLSAAG